MICILGHWVPANKVLRLGFDLLALSVTLVLAFVLLDSSELGVLAASTQYMLPIALGSIAVWCLIRANRLRPAKSSVRTAARVVLTFFILVPVAYGVSSLVPLPLGSGEMPYLPVLLLAVGTMLLVRGFAARRGFNLAKPRRVMVLGTGPEAALVEESLTGSGPQVRMVGFYAVRSPEAVRVPGDRILSDASSLLDATRSLNVDEIVVAVRDRRSGVVPLRELLDCRLAGVRVLDLSSYFEQARGQVRLDALRASWLIFGDGFRQGWLRSAVKRLFDIVTATLLLVVTAPVMMLAAVAIALESRGPILYRQERVGLGGRPFHLIKLRSMGCDAERDGTPRWASRDDTRVTRVGRIMRRLRIDELPQLFNVLSGTMSLVGPRPERPYFVDRLTREIPFYAVRHSVKPGVTGWAQVRYHYGDSVEDAAQKLQYDLYYVKNHSLFLDVVILADTVGVVLSGAGAH